MSAYTLRRAIRSPRAFFRRRREKNLTPEARVFYELNSYSDTFYAFMARLHDNPDLLVDFPLDAQSVVVDGGAFLGGWSERIADRTGATIYAFEPGAGAIRGFRARLGDRPNITLLEYGLDRVDAEVELSVRGPGSTVKAGTPLQGGQLTKATVRVRDVAAAFEELDIAHIDLLALNIEGAEYDVLDRLAETGWFARIDSLVVQFHEWEPRSHRRRKAIRDVLQQTHDERWCYPWIWEAWRRRS